LLKIKKKESKGYTLIECVIAMVVSLVGLLAIYSLVFTSVRIQILSREMSLTNSYAREKVEELKNSSRVVGGGVDSNVLGYFDTPSPKYVRRWQISGDTVGTQTVTVRVLPTVTDTLMPDATLVTRME
jgi:prepilin-type N-terminal cleavage/methylation domain-containing protein